MSLSEVLISVLIFALVIGAGTSLYLLGSKMWHKGSEIGERSQNSRVIMDRLSREIRQANEIASINDDSIMIEDGHVERLQYIKYYLLDNELKRQQIIYELNDNLVRYDTPDSQEIVEKNELIAENINGIDFDYQDSVNIRLTMEDKIFNTKINPRNAP